MMSRLSIGPAPAHLHQSRLQRRRRARLKLQSKDNQCLIGKERLEAHSKDRDLGMASERNRLMLE